MKLLFCPACQDVRKFGTTWIYCGCGLSAGRYIDEINAEISGRAIPLGFSNSSLVDALKAPLRADGMGNVFTAFVIPECGSIRRVKA